jgi:hypothetical protein
VDDFFLGTHIPAWLERTDVPLMISSRSLAERKRSLPRARGRVMIDSGGFTELDLNEGEWRTIGRIYAALGRRYVQEIGNVEWIAVQDMMCEPSMLAKTGLSIRTHQAMTIASYLELMDRAPEVPWLPVLQGWAPSDYFRHVDMYAAAGVDLSKMPLVGIGSVCRRQTFIEARYTLRELHARGIRSHGFGIKTAALRRLAPWLCRSDSEAWAQDARRESARERRHGFRRVPCPAGKTHSCSGCMPYAMAWRQRVLEKLERQAPLFRELAA